MAPINEINRIKVAIFRAKLIADYLNFCNDNGLPVDDIHLVNRRLGLAIHTLGIKDALEDKNMM